MLTASCQKAPSFLSATAQIDAIRFGLPVTTIDALIQDLGLTKTEVVELLGVSIRSIQRKKDKDQLTPNQSEHAIAIMNVMDEAMDYFGDREKVLRWIRTPKVAFSNHSPIQLFDTITGITLVSEEICRLKYGMIS